MLDAFRGEDARQEEMVRRARDLAASSPRCGFRDHFEPGHFTGSAWVVNEPGDKVLLIFHQKLQKWMQPGGHADGDFDLVRVARREVEEETGLRVVPVWDQIYDLDIHSIPPWAAEPAHLHFDVRFVFRADETQPLQAGQGVAAVRWVAVDALHAICDEESIVRLGKRCQDSFSMHLPPHECQNRGTEKES